MLIVHRGNRLETLADTLAGILLDPPADPFRAETVAVPGPGVQAWLADRLAVRLGICALTRFPFARTLFSELAHTLLGLAPPDPDPWEPARLRWAILAEMPDLTGQPGFDAIVRYVADDWTGPRALQLAGRLADTLNGYAQHRPEWVLEWQDRPDTADLPTEQRWQPALWRALVARLGADHLPGLVHRLAGSTAPPGPAPGGLPERIALFALPDLPPLTRRLLASLPTGLPVHLFLLSPSREYWGDVPNRKRGTILSLTGPDDLHREPGNALLAAFGRRGRDFVVCLEDELTYHEPDTDHYVDPAPPDGPAPGLLTALQSEALHLRRTGRHSHPALPLRVGDESIQVHACHGPLRETQVLADRLLERFSADPSLQPHQVAVLTPDPTIYVPLVETVFSDPGVNIPCVVTGRALRGETAIAEALVSVLQLTGDRLTLETGIALLGLAPVRARFGLGAADVDRCRGWCVTAGVRWGLDGPDRATHDQPGLSANTWRFGLDRLLLGYAMPGEASPFAGLAPADLATGLDAASLGGLAEFLATLSDTLSGLKRQRTAEAWRDDLLAVLNRLTLEDSENTDACQRVRERLTAWAAETVSGAPNVRLPLATVRADLTARFSRPAPGRSVGGGSVVVGDLADLAGIPFRIIALLGMAEGAWPRSDPAPGFDLLARRPKPGDPSRRDDDRWAFLSVLLGARDQLLILHPGRDPRDLTARPPAAPVEELLDAIEEGFSPPAGAAASTRVLLVHEHPLQPFSPRAFGTAPPVRRGWHPTWAEGAAALSTARRGPARPVFWPRRTPPGPTDPTLPLADLAAFWSRPAHTLLTRRVGLRPPLESESGTIREPLELDPLTRHGILTCLVESALSGQPPETAPANLVASGLLPLGTPGRLAMAELQRQATRLVEAIQQVSGATPPLPPLGIAIPQGQTTLTGELDGQHPNGRVIWRVGRHDAPRHLVKAWVEHLVMAAAAEAAREIPRPTWLVAWHPQHARADIRVLRPVPGAAARLTRLTRLYAVAQTRPLPFFPATGEAFVRAEQRLDGATTNDPWRAAELAWQSEHRHAFGDRDWATGRLWPDWHPLTERDNPSPTGFAALARTIYVPLLAALAKGET